MLVNTMIYVEVSLMSTRVCELLRSNVLQFDVQWGIDVCSWASMFGWDACTARERRRAYPSRAALCTETRISSKEYAFEHLNLQDFT